MTEPAKTPGQEAYEQYTFERLPNPHSQELWTLCHADVKASWEQAAAFVRAPLLQRIAELEAEVRKINHIIDMEDDE